jgi:hypothetical protein
MDCDRNLKSSISTESQPDISRRDLLEKAGKALYIAPTLTLLGSAKATAQFPSGPPCDPGGGTCSSPAAAPTPAAPTQ